VVLPAVVGLLPISVSETSSPNLYTPTVSLLLVPHTSGPLSSTEPLMAVCCYMYQRRPVLT